MNELTSGQLDQSLFDENLPVDNRKPLRKFIDDKLIPYGGPIAAVPIGAIGAVNNILNGASTVPKQVQIG